MLGLLRSDTKLGGHVATMVKRRNIWASGHGLHAGPTKATTDRLLLLLLLALSLSDKLSLVLLCLLSLVKGLILQHLHLHHLSLHLGLVSIDGIWHGPSHSTPLCSKLPQNELLLLLLKIVE